MIVFSYAAHVRSTSLRESSDRLEKEAKNAKLEVRQASLEKELTALNAAYRQPRQSWRLLFFR